LFLLSLLLLLLVVVGMQSIVLFVFTTVWVWTTLAIIIDIIATGIPPFIVFAAFNIIRRSTSPCAGCGCGG
jgi:hypothetical protein